MASGEGMCSCRVIQIYMYKQLCTNNKNSFISHSHSDMCVLYTALSSHLPARIVNQHYIVSQTSKGWCIPPNRFPQGRSRFTSHSPLITKTLYIYHPLSLLYVRYPPRSISHPSFSPFSLSSAVISGLLSPVMLQTLPFPSSFSLTPISPNSPASLYFYHSIAVISPWHRFNTHTPPPFLAKPFLHPSSLSLSLFALHSI